MGTLRNLAWGLIVVAVDLKINQLDLLADPLGWAIALVALLKLRALHPVFGAASAAAALGLLASVPDWLGVGGLPITASTGIAELGVVFAVCTALMDLVPAKRHVADQLRKWGLGLAAVFVPVGLVLQTDDGDLGGILLVVAILTGVGIAVVFVWFLVLLFQSSRMGPAAPVPSLRS